MRIAQSINIKNEIKTAFITDINGNPTEETYEYKEYEVLDSEGNVLEVGKYTQESITVEEILQQTGIVFGVSAWIFN